MNFLDMFRKSRQQEKVQMPSINGIEMPELEHVNMEDPLAVITLKMLMDISKLGVTLEEYISALIAVQMGLEGLRWEDYWILVAKYASKVPQALIIAANDSKDE